MGKEVQNGEMGPRDADERYGGVREMGVQMWVQGNGGAEEGWEVGCRGRAQRVGGLRDSHGWRRS